MLYVALKLINRLLLAVDSFNDVHCTVYSILWFFKQHFVTERQTNIKYIKKNEKTRKHWKALSVEVSKQVSQSTAIWRTNVQLLVYSTVVYCKGYGKGGVKSAREFRNCMEEYRKNHANFRADRGLWISAYVNTGVHLNL